MASILTPTAMLSFPHLFVKAPRSQAPNAPLAFQATFIFNEAAQKTPEWANLRKGVGEAIDEKFGTGKCRDASFVKMLRLPFAKTATKDYAGYDSPNGIFVRAWTNNQPGVVDERRQDIIDPAEVWAGQLVRATLHPFGYDNSGNRGVAFNLNNLQRVKKDMPRLDGRQNANKEFDDVAGAGGDDDDSGPFGGSSAPDDDEPPFFLGFSLA